jgi:hypothetical protein
VYTDLGFQELALTEGWKSVNTDPSNFSAHRFLADSYSVLPRHEVARVSELLQSQLLQPLNMTPIQPHLAESNLFLLSAQGPAALSFNEFNPVFNRNGITAQAGSVLGENNTYAGEGVISGIYNKTSFSVGGFHLTTDGFRRNADQRDDIANAFIQQEISPKASIQAEYRYRNNERGDLRQRFFPADFFPGERNTEERHTARLGGRYAFSPTSILLGSFTYHHADFGSTDNQFPLFPPSSFLKLKRPEDGFSAEIQHLFRLRHFNLVSGVGHFNIDGKATVASTINLPLPPEGPGPILSSTTSSTDLEHTNLYAYSYINLIKNVTFTLGFSADFVKGDSPDVGDVDQFNPKFGITWEPIPGTTLRAAAFRVLKRTLLTDQTLEPTQVAGFNQFYDDFNGTEAWRYGGAIDQKFSRDIFGGVEFAMRDLTVPGVSIDPSTSTLVRIKADWHEYLGRAYLFWTPHEWLAFRAEYMFEQFKQPKEFNDQTIELNTHRVPVGFNFFHPSGLSTMLTATYWNQDGRLAGFLQDATSSISDNFWTVDTAVSYRLPKRYGFISIGATNLFDKKFKFFNTDFDNPFIQPDRMFFARITLALPYGETFEH